MMRIIGSILLIAGSCIGAGMLGLPVVSSFSGFVPISIFFLIVWSYMLVTSLLLLEAYLWYPNQKVNLITVAKDTLGEVGKWIVIISFIFLFYCLMIAYLTKGGQLVTKAMQIKLATQLPGWSGPLVLTVFTMLLVEFGTKQVDIFNRAGMLGLFVTYIYVLSLAPGYARHDVLSHQDYSTFLFVVPFLVVSFGFHNMVPTIIDYLNNDHKRIITSIKVGSFIPLLIYLFWILAVFLVVPLRGEVSLLSAYNAKQIAIEPLAVITGDTSLATFAHLFAFFAIVTSVFGQALSVVDFLADAIKNKFINVRWHYELLFFVPCFILAQLNTDVFFKALEYAGGIAAVMLFGFIPGLIVWRGRYHLRLGNGGGIETSAVNSEKKDTTKNNLKNGVKLKQYKLPGGKLLLVLIILAGLFVFALEIARLFNFVDITPVL